MKIVINKFISESTTGKEWDIFTYELHPRDTVILIREKEDAEIVYPKKKSGK